MSEHVSQAKQAREILARALSALQSDPTVPPSLMDVAEPVAMAMGALHAIERSNQLGTASSARDNVRRALGMLQTQADLNHPAVINATESVASSLGIIFGLVKAGEAAPAAPAAQPTPQATPAFQPAPAAPAYQQPAPAQAAPAQPAYQQPAPAYQQPAPAYQQPAYQQPAPAQPAYQQPAPAYQQPAQPAYQQPAPAQPAYQQPAPAQPAYQQPAPVQAAPAAPAALNDPFATAPAAPAPPPARPSSMASTRFEVALGINSPTNFYKGLSGNDVIEHGGIFVATYSKVPSVGTGIALRIMLPGGFEFESTGVVVWIRDSNSGESPGFGARFVQISADAKQLVYRYVRNREPLFYDDLL